MYKIFIRPFLFLFQPETIHHFTFRVFKFLRYFLFIKPFFRVFFWSEKRDVSKEVFGIKFKNPVGLAAGLDKNAEVYDLIENFGFSFIEIGTVTPKGQAGNPKPRSFRLKKDKALINRMGFNNKGLNCIVNNLKKRKANAIIGGNIGKNTATPNEEANNDYIKCFEGLYDYVDYFTVNVSCPNVKDLRKLQDRDTLLELLGTLKELRSKRKTSKPILLKISPDLTIPQLDDTISIVDEIGIDGIVAVNTTTSREGLSYSKEHIEKIDYGGLSGKPLKDRSTEMIRYISKKTEGKIPIIGVGGIMTAEDALEKIKAGASLVQIYTGFIYEGPGLVKKINKAIANYENSIKEL